MTMAGFKTVCNTATETRAFARGLGTLYPEKRLPEVVVADAVSGAHPQTLVFLNCLLLPGIDAVVQRGCHHWPCVSDTDETCVAEVAEWVTRLAYNKLPDARRWRLAYSSGQGVGDWWGRFSADPMYLSPPVGDESSARNLPGPTSEEAELIDWDVRIETPPPRPSQYVVVRFEKGSYRLPRVDDDPED